MIANRYYKIRTIVRLAVQQAQLDANGDAEKTRHALASRLATDEQLRIAMASIAIRAHETGVDRAP